MAMKIISQATKTFALNGKEVECVVTRREGKVRRRDGWRQCVSTEGHCSLYENCYWFPENTDGNETAAFSCDGWEPREPEFADVDAVVTAMVREMKGWGEAGEADQEIERITKGVQNV